MRNLSRGLMALAVLLGIAMMGAPAHAVPITGTYGSPTSNCGSYTPPVPNKSVVQFGDSITARTTPWLLDLRPSWEVNGLAGRNVDCLPMLVETRLDAGYIGKLIIALGTNATEGWTKADYQAVVDMVPDTKPVIMVTTFRDPEVFTAENGYNYRALASTQYKYSKWMVEIANENPNVCIANWRVWAINHRDLIGDGVHPKRRLADIPAREAYAKIVTERVGTCTVSAKR